MLLSEILPRMNLGIQEERLIEFLRLCRKAGYRQISFFDVKSNSPMGGVPFKMNPNVYGTPHRSRSGIWGTPKLVNVAEQAGVYDPREGHGTDKRIDMCLVEKKFAETIGPMTFTLREDGWRTQVVYTPYEYSLLLRIYGDNWPGDRNRLLDDSYIRALFSRGWGLGSKNRAYHLIFTYPLKHVPLFINDQSLCKIVQWRLRLGR